MNALVEWNYASVGYENGWLQSVVQFCGGRAKITDAV